MATESAPNREKGSSKKPKARQAARAYKSDNEEIFVAMEAMRLSKVGRKPVDPHRDSEGSYRTFR